MQNGRRVALDYGSVRIGVAMSDASGLLASPYENFDAQHPELSTQLSEFFAEYQPIYIVVGNPRHLSGDVSAKGESVAQFVTLVKECTDSPVYLIDERLTTVSAARTLKDAGLNTRESRSHIDSAAAVAILESAMNQERLQGVPSKDRA
jgi:putative Holliday junction resolvase